MISWDYMEKNNKNNRTLDEILGILSIRDINLRKEYWVAIYGSRKSCFGKYTSAHYSIPPACHKRPWKHDPCCEECIKLTKEFNHNIRRKLESL